MGITIYTLEVRPAALRALRKIDPTTQKRIRGALELLARNPHPPASRQLRGRPGYRVQVGSYRIIYTIETRNYSSSLSPSAIGETSTINKNETDKSSEASWSARNTGQRIRKHSTELAFSPKTPRNIKKMNQNWFCLSDP